VSDERVRGMRGAGKRTVALRPASSPPTSGLTRSWKKWPSAGSSGSRSSYTLSKVNVRASATASPPRPTPTCGSPGVTCRQPWQPSARPRGRHTPPLRRNPLGAIGRRCEAGRRGWSVGCGYWRHVSYTSRRTSQCCISPERSERVSPGGKAGSEGLAAVSTYRDWPVDRARKTRARSIRRRPMSPSALRPHVCTHVTGHDAGRGYGPP
jgi:hypothetical protein